MNQSLADTHNPTLIALSATGDAIPETQVLRAVRPAPATFVPVKYTVLEYGKHTTQLYDGDDRALADAQWQNVEHGIFLAANNTHAWITIAKR